MSVPAGTARAIYYGTGSPGPFAFNFKLYETSHLRVVKTSLLGVETVLTETTDYIVSLATDFASATVLLVDDLAGDGDPESSEQLTLLRNPPISQLIEWPRNDPFPAATHERAADLAVMVAGRLSERLDRALTLPESSTQTGLTLPEPEADRFLGWSSAGDALVNKLLSDASAISLPAPVVDGQMIVENGTSGADFRAASVFVNDSENMSVGVNTQSLTIAGAETAARLSLHEATDAQIEQVLRRASATAAVGATLVGARGRGSLGTPTIVSSGDRILRLLASAFDGSEYSNAAAIDFEIDGTPGANDVPGRLVFRVSPDGNENLVEALRIAQNLLATFAGDVSAVNALLSGYMNLPEIASPSNPVANNIRLFAKDLAGVTRLYTRDSAGTESIIPIGSRVSTITRTVITATGTYTSPAGLAGADFELQAAGGGSGSADGANSAPNGSASAGGGGGEYARGYFDAATLGASQSVTVGAVGAAGVGNGGNGGNASASSVGSLMTANGGSGGTGTGSASQGAAVAGGAGGTGGTGGDYRVPGGAGGSGAGWTTNTAGDSGTTIRGSGGMSFLGRGPGPLMNTTASSTASVAAVAGANYGAGASGGANHGSTAINGATGGPGICIATNYIAA